MNNSTALKTLVGLMLAAMVGAIIYLAVVKNNENLPPIIDGSKSFTQTGNLVKGNPGMKPDAWYLVYEELGQPALTAELMFTSTSECVASEQRAVCEPDDFTQGERVTVDGKDKDGLVTVKTLTRLDFNNPAEDALIRVTSPQPYANVTSPLTITGEARGTWYFEASFPVRILDANGKELGVSYAQAQDEWMTEEFVPFVSTLTFSTPSTETGLLVLEKDNPSGLPEHGDELRIPVTFVKTERTVKLYYYDADKDRDSSGNVLCSEQGLVAVERKIPVTKTPIQDTIRLLLEGELTAQEEVQGVETEFPLTGLELEGANLSNSHLTLEFNDPQNQTGGGACRVGVLWRQIEATAKQFPEVQSVSFIPEELFQP